MKKLAVFVVVILFLGVPLAGCKEKQGVSTGSKETAHIVFDQSKMAKTTAGFVDTLDPQKVSVNEPVHAGGWAYDPQRKTPAMGVVILADGSQLPVVVPYNLKREDVAKALKNDGLADTGWDVSFNVSSLGGGKHKLEFYALLHDGMFSPLEYHGMTYAEIEVMGK